MSLFRRSRPPVADLHPTVAPMVSRRLFGRALAIGLPVGAGVLTVSDTADAAPPAWTVTGNSGLSPTANFLGTADAEPLAFRTDNVERARFLASGLFGIGTTVPAAALHSRSAANTAVRGDHVGATGAAPGVQGVSLSNTGGACGVLGQLTTTNPGNGAGAVRGVMSTGSASTTAGAGVIGHHTSIGTGVLGYTDGSGTGVLGQAVGGTAVSGANAGYGIGGAFASTSGNGVYCVSSGDGSGLEAIGYGDASGGYFYSDSSDGLTALSDDTSGASGSVHAQTSSGFAVLATAGSGGSAVRAVGSSHGFGGYLQSDGTALIAYSSAPSGSGYLAGAFDGDVHVGGTLSKSGGAFRIDHPDDPSRRYLSHSFVESPDMMNVYNGIATMDGDGRGSVTMPDWFEGLNRDFRYQLTALGSPAPQLHIATEMAHGTFAIAGGHPGQRVSWQVTGVRRDAWAEAHRIPVESDKPAHLQGTYLHPELFGQPRSTQEWYQPTPAITPLARPARR